MAEKTMAYASDRHMAWQQLASLRASSLVSPRKARPSTAQLEALSPFAHCDGSLSPAKLLSAVRSVLGAELGMIRDDFEIDGNGLAMTRRHSELMDALVRHLLELAGRRVSATGHEVPGPQLAVAAVGGYGRAQLAPGSDIDLLFLVPRHPPAHSVQAIEFVLYRLWDLGLRVGHVVRSVGECINLARSDWRTGISLLDLRYLWGRRALYDELVVRFRAEIATGGEALVDALACDLARRHARFHDPAAPDVKRGRGGLRDLQTLLWLGKIRGQVRPPDHVVDFGVSGACRLRWP
jgi:[protein-PII] uridylyltransferase